MQLKNNAAWSLLEVGLCSNVLYRPISRVFQRGEDPLDAIRIIRFKHARGAKVPLFLILNLEVGPGFHRLLS